jgi:hypothetical protein
MIGRDWVFRRRAVVAPLDTDATEYDSISGAVKLVDNDGDGIGEPQRGEAVQITFPAKIEYDREELLRMTASGNLPDSAVGIVTHVSYLKKLGLITTARPKGVKVSDRLVKVTKKKGEVIEDYTAVPVYCTHSKHLQDVAPGAGLLLYVFADRPRGRP